MSGARTGRSPIRPTWPQIVALSAIGPILFGCVALWMGSAMHRTDHSRADLARSFEYRRELEVVGSLLKDAETGQRGYILSGDASFLGPYQLARHRLPDQLDLIERLAPATPQTTLVHRELRAAAAARLAEMQSLIDFRRQAGLAAAASRLSEGVGKRQMDRIRTILATLSAQAADVLATREKAEHQRIALARRALWLAELVLAVASATTGFLLGRSQRARSLLALEREGAAARQRAIFDNAVDAIIVINPSGSIETINPAAEEMFGYSADELLRRDIATLIDLAPGDGPFLARLGVQDLQIRQGSRMNVPGRRRSGDAIFVDVSLGAMQLPDGIHVVATLRDATARREIEQLKDDFISTVSHELRTPLTSIVGSLGLLRGGAAGDLPAAAERLTEIAESNSQRLIRLINDILDVDQIQKGRMAFDYAAVDLRDVVRKTVQTMGGLADRAGVTVEVRLSDAPAPACADGDRLIQAAGNLLSNAIKFSPAGSTISFELVAGGDEHIIQITDQGPGIDPEFAKHIFNRFSQANRPNNQMIAGTGLGLAISREIVRCHGGDISFENRAGGGARFAFSVPRDQGEAERSGAAARILVCEEDVEAGRTLQSMLSAHGYINELVPTLHAAAEHLTTGEYDILLLGLARADTESAARLKQIHPGSERRRVPVIVVAKAPPPGEIDADLAGWLQRPVDPYRLTELIQRAVHMRTNHGTLVLHVDDDADSHELFAAAVAGRCRIVHASTLAKARTILRERKIDAVVLDLGLPDGSGEALLKELKEPNKRIPVVLYSAQDVSDQARKMADAVFVKSRRSLAKLASTLMDIVDRRGPNND